MQIRHDDNYTPAPVDSAFEPFMPLYRQAHEQVHETWPWWIGARGGMVMGWTRFDRTWQLSYSQGTGEVEIKRLDIDPMSEEGYAITSGQPPFVQGPMYGALNQHTVTERFPIGQRQSGSGMGGMQWTGDPLMKAQGVDTYPDLWAFLDETIQRLDAELPLPVPPLMVGQVWQIPAGEHITIQGVQGGQAWAWLWHAGQGHAAAEWFDGPAPGWKLLHGPTPWGRDIPIPVIQPAEAP